MAENMRQVSLAYMLKRYLNVGGIPPDRDLDAFHYDPDIKTVTEGVELGRKICIMGQSVAEHGRNNILFRDVSVHPQMGGNEDNGSGDDCEEDDSSRGSVSVNIAIYRNDERTRKLLAIDPVEDQGATDTKGNAASEVHHEWIGRPVWSETVVFLQAETNHRRCAFEFEPPDEDEDSDDDDSDSDPEHDVSDYRERFLERIAQIFGHQHRTHLFAVYAFRDQARIIFVDRSGAIVSEPFRYGTRDHPTLHMFFWKIARMTDKELGFDESVSLASDADVEAMREYAATVPTEYLRTQAYKALSWDPNALEGQQPKSFEWPMYKLVVGDKTVFAGRPTFASGSLFGGCTRAYVVFEKVDGEDSTVWRLRFLKDVWRRKDTEGRIRPEHEVYERLRANDVRDYVLTCLAAGDVLNADGASQLTRLHDIVRRKRYPGCHYRILLEEVCRPLTDFEDFRELSAILRDALQGHKDAWEKAGVLHRDVSFNNILIYEFKSGDGTEERRGVLNDWDLSMYKEEMLTSMDPTEPDHKGTWHFRSAVLGRYPTKPYELSDDIESFVHVYHYSVLRFHHTSRTHGLVACFALHFDSHAIRPQDGAHLGGYEKLVNMRSTIPFMRPTGNLSLRFALRALAKICSDHYATINEDEYDLKYDPELAGTPAGEHLAQALARRPARRPKQTSVPQDRPLADHRRLLSFFKDTSNPAEWEKPDLKKDKDLFKMVGLAPRKNNHFSSSTQSS